MSRHDVREYLTKVYNLPVRDVRTEVRMGEMLWNLPRDYRNKKALWKEADKKYAFVFMKKDFTFEYPNLFPEDTEMKEIEKATAQLKNAQRNARFANRDRAGVGKLLGP